MLGDAPTDHRRPRAERVAAHCGQHPIGVVGGHEGQQLAFVRHLQGVQAEEAARVANLGRDREGAFVQRHPDVRGLRDLVERRGHPAPGGITQDVQVGAGVDHRGDQPVQRRGVAGHRGREGQAFTAAHHRDPVHADVAADDHGVTGHGPLRTDVDARVDDADARGVDEHTVAVTGIDHLGIAGHQLHPGRERRGADGLGDMRDFLQRGAFFEDECRRQRQRLGSGHREIVDGSVDREVADGAAGKRQRLDHK